MSHRIVAASLSLFLAIAAPLAAQRGSRPAPSAGGSNAINDPFGESPASNRIVGTVRTTDGRAVTDAHIDARRVERGSRSPGSASTDSTGAYVIYNLAPGTYEVTVTSGVNEARERVTVTAMAGDATCDFRLADKPSEGTASAANGTAASTVSLSQYKVPSKARGLYDKAVQAMAHGKVDEALEKANAAITAFPKFSEALTLRGLLEQHAGKSPEAIADFQQSIQFDPNYAQAYVALASTFSSTGRFDESLPLLGQAERLAPSSWQVYFELARAQIGKEQYAAALHNADRAGELLGKQQDRPEVHLVRGYALVGLNQYPRATEELQTYLAREPKGRTADAARQVLAQLPDSTATASR